MDNITDFVNRFCVIAPNARAKKRDIYQQYVRYCARNGKYPATKTRLCMRLMELGCKETRIGPKRQLGFLGIGLLAKPLPKRRPIECPTCNTVNVVGNSNVDIFCRECRKKLWPKLKPAA